MQRRLLYTLLGTVIVTVLAFGANLIAGNTPNLGLDLQGGASVTLTPRGAFEDGAIDVAVEIIRNRVDSIGVAEPEIVRQGDTVVVNLPGVSDQQRAIDLVSVTGKVLLRPVLQYLPGAAVTPDPIPVDPDATTPDDTTPGETTPEETAPEETAPDDEQGAPRAVPDTTEAPETTDVPATTDAPGTTDAPETTDAPAEPGEEPEQDPGDPLAQVVLSDDDGGLYLLGPAFPDGLGGFASGEVFRNDARADIFDGQWVVVVGLRPGAEGRDRWNGAASQCYSRTDVCPSGQMAIVLDGTVISAPTVQTPIFDDEVQITGSFRESEARDLAKILEFGAVPVEFDAPTARTVSATLGGDTLRAAIVAGLVGIALVILFLFVYYRLMAAVVLGGVVVFGLLTWTVVSLLSETRGLALTLAGATGLIVSIGIMVDSYILLFERLKDELRAGRTLRNSVRRGFEMAWKTIVVANVVTFIGAGILWYLTVGSVRGFAFFLGLATVTNVVVVYLFARPAILLLGRAGFLQGRDVLGVPVSTTEPQGVAR